MNCLDCQCGLLQTFEKNTQPDGKINITIILKCPKCESEFVPQIILHKKKKNHQEISNFATSEIKGVNH